HPSVDVRRFVGWWARAGVGRSGCRRSRCSVSAATRRVVRRKQKTAAPAFRNRGPGTSSVVPRRSTPVCARHHTPSSARRGTRGVRSFAAADLPPGEIEGRVDWSSVNYKDALATVVDGKVARISPLIPGIDLAGVVVGSADPAFPVGAEVLAHGYDLGVARHG